MTAISDRYQRRAEAFQALVEGVNSDQWSNRSPCEKWTASDVVDHVVVMHHVVLRTTGRAPTPTGDDPLTAFRTARADIENALGDATISTLESETRGGRMTFEEQVDRIVSSDLPIHGWDLAKATGQDDSIRPEDVEGLWKEANDTPPELMDLYRTPGALGPGVEVYGAEIPIATEAPLQHRLLGFVGRDPDWKPPT